MWATETLFKADVYWKSSGFHENDSPNLISKTSSKFGSDYGMTEGSSELNGACCSDLQDVASLLILITGWRLVLTMALCPS